MKKQPRQAKPQTQQKPESQTPPPLYEVETRPDIWHPAVRANLLPKGELHYALEDGRMGITKRWRHCPPCHMY